MIKLKKLLNVLLSYLNIRLIKYNIDRINTDGVYKFHYGAQPKNLINLKKNFFQKINSKIIVFDIGANFGQSIKRFKSIAPLSLLYSYEPTHMCYNFLKKKFSFDPNVKIYQLAIDSKIKKKKINFTSYGSSSFYDLSPKNRRVNFVNNFIESNKNFFLSKSSNYIKNFKNLKTKELVYTSTIDDEIKKNKIKKINILKIDVQGYEHEVLKGAKNSIKRQKIDFIEFEQILSDMYEIDNEKNFYSILKLLNECDYKILSIKPNGRTNFYFDTDYHVEVLCCSKKIYKFIKNFHYKNKNNIIFR